MKTARWRARPGSGSAFGAGWWVPGIVMCVASWLAGQALAQPRSDFVRRARIIETARLGLSGPDGVAFSTKADQFLVPQPSGDGSGSTEFALINQLGRRAGTSRIAVAIPDTVNLTFDAKAGRLLFYDAAPDQILGIAVGPDGLPSSQAEPQIVAASVGVADARGMAVDPASGRIFVLDSTGPSLVVVEPGAEPGQGGTMVSAVPLKPFRPGTLRGVGFDPTNGRLQIMSPSDQRLYEVTSTGLVMANRDVSVFDLRDPQGMLFAPSGDQTDDPLELSLYVAERGGAATAGQISELSLIPTPWPRGRDAGDVR